jgi:Holliday junction resolvase RusA-like endonuclease
MAQTLFMLWPISTNNLWRAVRGRNILSERYRFWLKAASLELMVQHPKAFKGPVRVAIALSSPTKRPFDLDNRAKAVLDLLVHNLVIESDSCTIVRYLEIGLTDKAPGAYVTITPWEEG